MNNANKIRKLIIQAIHKAQSGHYGSALSCADILSVLYEDILRLKDYENRDIFILSKAHAAVALYATLHHFGLMNKSTFEGFYENTLPAHTDRFTHKYIEISAGSLGHGMPMALGMAYSFLKKDKNDRKVYCLIGDGEMQEGSIYESALLASKLELNNLCVFLDNNNLQGYDRGSDIYFKSDLKNMWKSFGWECFEVDGHNEKAIKECILNHQNSKSTKPLFIICNTTKGKGVSFMEDKLKWHYALTTQEQYEKAINCLNNEKGGKNEK